MFKLPLTVALVLVISQTSFAETASQYQQIKSHINAGNWAAAEKLLSTSDLNQNEFKLLQGVILGNKGTHAKAMEIFRSMEKTAPATPEVLNNLAVLYAFKGDYDAAEQALTKAMATNPSYQTSYQNLRNLYTHKASLAYSKALKNHNKPKGMTLSFALPDYQPPQPIPTEPPAPLPTPKKNDFSVDKKLIVEHLNDWTKAWSNKDLSGYLKAFSDDYAPANWERRHWINQRKNRLEKPNYIRVELEDIQVDMVSEVVAIVTFVQQYESDNYRDKELKLMILRKIEQQWKIVDEAKRG